MQLAAVDTDHVTLALTASSTFLDVPVYRNGARIARVTLEPDSTVYVLDGAVLSGGSYTYLAGGYFLLGLEEVWSDPLDVIVP